MRSWSGGVDSGQVPATALTRPGSRSAADRVLPGRSGPFGDLGHAGPYDLGVAAIRPGLLRDHVVITANLNNGIANLDVRLRWRQLFDQGFLVRAKGFPLVNPFGGFEHRGESES